MIQFSLSWLHAQLEPSGKAPANLLDWYLDLDANQSERLAPYLTEPPGKVTKAYILRANPTDPDLAAMEVIDVHAGNQGDFPFNQASGPRSPAIGPVVKRTKSKVKIAPTEVIATSTLKHFKAVAEAGEAWSPFFAEAHDILTRPKLAWNGGIISDSHPNAYQTAIQVIDETETVFVSIQDAKERRPGQVPEYAIYLQGILAETKYATNTAPAIPETRCALTGITGTCYANGLAGARVNLSNVDRPGAFPGVTTDNAGKRFAISRQACDLLYIFRFHLLPKLLAEVGGSRALVLPTFLSSKKASMFQKKFADYVEKLNTKDIEGAEGGLSRMYLEEETAVAGLHFVWATFGQKMEDVTFQMNDVLPSRIHELKSIWDKLRLKGSPFSPDFPVEKFQQDAWMNAAYYLYRRPGGKAAKMVNSDRLHDFIQYLMVHIYRGQPFSDSQRLLVEAQDVAQYYLRDMIDNGDFYGMTREGFSKRKGEAYPTLAGFMKAHHLFYQYLTQLDLMTTSPPLNVTLDALQPFFGAGTGLDTKDKGSAFIFGILFGRLLTLQQIRGVNVAANALPMVRNYRMHPREERELYQRIVGKLHQYHGDPNARISRAHRELFEGLLAEHLTISNQGASSDLPQADFNYFFLLGQSATPQIFTYEKKESTDQGATE